MGFYFWPKQECQIFRQRHTYAGLHSHHDAVGADRVRDVSAGAKERRCQDHTF